MPMYNDGSTKEPDYLAARILPENKLFVFWQLQNEKVNFMADYFNLSEIEAVRALRLYETCAPIGERRDKICILEVILRHGVTSWLFKGINEKRNYVVELGINRNEDDFFPLLRSNAIILNTDAIYPGAQDLSAKAPGWAGQVSTYTYYENLEGSSKK
jgi:hypothetical protein